MGKNTQQMKHNLELIKPDQTAFTDPRALSDRAIAVNLAIKFHDEQRKHLAEQAKAQHAFGLYAVRMVQIHEANLLADQAHIPVSSAMAHINPTRKKLF